MKLEKKSILGIEITDASLDRILEYIILSVKNSAKKMYVVTPNPEILVYALKHSNFRKIINNANVSLCDGIGIQWAGKMLGISLGNRVTGTDLFYFLCKEIENEPITIGLLGGREGVAQTTAECLKAEFPKLKIVFISSQDPNELSVKEIRNADPVIDILFVAFGFPKQEEWIFANLENLPIKAAMGVGGAFDYISKSVKRAPKPIQALGFEWLYRLIMQPWRAKRELALIEFICLVLQEKFSRISQNQ